VPKSYVIPIDDSGFAYLGVKALTSPYPNGNVYCPGCPTIFGGNVEHGQGEAETLYQEARQESHYKIDLNQMFIEKALQPATAVNSFLRVYQTQHNGQPMNFYVLKGNFVFDQAPFTSSEILEKDVFRETTGDIVKVDLRGQNFQNAADAADAAIAAMPWALQIRITPEARQQFYASHSAEALRRASELP
jgi:hypothetical protein